MQNVFYKLSQNCIFVHIVILILTSTSFTDINGYGKLISSICAIKLTNIRKFRRTIFYL